MCLLLSSSLLIFQTLRVILMTKGNPLQSPGHVCCHGNIPTHILAMFRSVFLDRPFYHIWTSRNMQQALLLPPATGVEWASPSSKHSRSSGSHGNTTATGGASNGGTSSSGGTVEKARRPPLFDPDPTHQVTMDQACL